MKEKMQHTIDAIFKMASMQEKTAAPVQNIMGVRPDNALSRAIRNEKEAEQFQAELKAVIALQK
ncbi:MAG: hypothetical protein ACLGH8_15100 [Bacteroidia bacterium]